MEGLNFIAAAIAIFGSAIGVVVSLLLLFR